jgi:hypothetical protein
MKPEKDADAIDMMRILTVGFVAVLIFGVGIFWAYRIHRRIDPGLRGPGSTVNAKDIGRQEIGIVDQVLFEGDHRLSRFRASERRHLSSYGWVDRERGIVHIPIEEAMRRIAGEGGAAR